MRIVASQVEGPVGRLEALLRIPATPRGAAVVAHPHPLHGGTMHTKVVHRAARLLADSFGLATLRFNFRGVGASEGVHDDGRGEVDDLLAATRAVRAACVDGPLVLSGFSFGSLCTIAAAGVVRPEAVLLIGVPLLLWDRSAAEALAGVPVAWVQGEDDGFGGADLARAAATRLGWTLHVVPGTDHFFSGHLDAFEKGACEALAPILAGS